ncbi:hypothetical protein SNE40_012078 [Patella caerulea]|uniref:Uncharacterized protein n=1 Tax=Patella caerulea TaxID=87958 RepID=A0AAN8JKX7_PATCE
MASKGQLTSTDIHVRILYLITLLLTTLIATTVWMGYTELKRLKILLDDKVSKSEVMYVRFKESGFMEDDQILPSTWSDPADQRQYTGDDNNSEEVKSTRERRHVVEGSGSANPDDWAWLSSYSRIPVSRTLFNSIPFGLSIAATSFCHLCFFYKTSFRYMIPGILFLKAIFICLFLSHHDSFWEYLAHLSPV